VISGDESIAAALTSDPFLGPSLSVKSSHFDIQAVLAREGVVAIRDHPDLVGPIRWLVRRGDLHAVLPGVYAPRSDVDTLDTRIRALMAWDPNAVLVGAAAARVSFWPTIRVPTVTCALKHHRQPQRGFHFSRRQVPAELVVSRGSLRYTSPAMTALDLSESHGGDAIDEALRARATTLQDLHRALQLTSARLGNAERRRMLLDSKDEPWSAAERKFHRLLRDAGMTAWKANQPVVLGGSLFFLDVAFRGVKLAIELDGRLYHSGSEVFETDRWRQNLLILDGWCVLRFTSVMIDERPTDVIAMVREALEMLGAA
jgi:very-short-patch-repair endonuclease